MTASVLVVDDDQALAEMLGIVLRKEGYDVATCGDGGRAVAMFRELRPDLVISDGRLLRVHVAELLPGSPEPAALEHAALRWVGPADLDALDWVEVDRAVLPDLAAVLAA